MRFGTSLCGYASLGTDSLIPGNRSRGSPATPDESLRAVHYRMLKGGQTGGLRRNLAKTPAP